jgi:hypothetical protein
MIKAQAAQRELGKLNEQDIKKFVVPTTMLIEIQTIIRQQYIVPVFVVLNIYNISSSFVLLMIFCVFYNN